MRSFKHWSPRYLLARLADLLYQKIHPGRPWLTPQAVRILERELGSGSVGLEFGSGRSTVWLARRVRHLTSVEHDPTWIEKLGRELKKKSLTNVDAVHAPKDLPNERGGDSSYVHVLDRFKDGSLDFALVDGKFRDFCTLGALAKLRPGGMLVIDDVQRYLPSTSRSPYSRTPAQGPAGPVWEEVADTLANWRVIWTSSGVSDTALYFKPGD